MKLDKLNGVKTVFPEILDDMYIISAMTIRMEEVALI